MTTISGNSVASSTNGGSANSMSAYNNLTEGDFMTLLTTQLANQDPTNPVDDTQMLAQLAQFSTLAAADTTNTDLSTISSQISTATGTPGVGGSTDSSPGSSGSTTPASGVTA
jgi:flagellar basal-body rod modification protein FlgD